MSLGPNDTQNVVITKGLAPGQAVVTDGADRLKDGAKVRLVEPGKPAAEPAAGAPDPSAPAKDRLRGPERQRSGG